MCAGIPLAMKAFIACTPHHPTSDILQVSCFFYFPWCLRVRAFISPSDLKPTGAVELRTEDIPATLRRDVGRDAG